MKQMTYGRKFEIYYEMGGHCGPYHSLFHAVRDAARKLLGCHHARRTVVRDRAIADTTVASIVAVEKTPEGKIVLGRIR